MPLTVIRVPAISFHGWWSWCHIYTAVKYFLSLNLSLSQKLASVVIALELIYVLHLNVFSNTNTKVHQLVTNTQAYVHIYVHMHVHTHMYDWAVWSAFEHEFEMTTVQFQKNSNENAFVFCCASPTSASKLIPYYQMCYQMLGTSMHDLLLFY